MRACRAGSDHGVSGALETMLDRHIAGREIDDAAGNEEWRHPPRPALFQHNTGVSDAARTTNACAHEHAGHDLIFVGLRLPTRIVERLRGCAHREDDELVNLALLLRLPPLI